MNIAEVLNESIIAVFKAAGSHSLVLKGGSAIRLFENDDHRMSIDADFSLDDRPQDVNDLFNQIHTSLAKEFGQRGFLVIDFETKRRPSHVADGFPATWGGWACRFKLVKKAFGDKPIDVQRRNALIPEGANSSAVPLDISDGEYCGARRYKTINGVKICGYTRELLVLEKIRAICQQHPSYRFTSAKNRARDFYDIERLSQHMDDDFVGKCRKHLEPVFKAKEVPMELLSAFWDKEFLSDQERGFQEVVDTVSGRLESFDVYVEHLRRLIRLLAPDAVKLPQGPSS